MQFYDTVGAIIVVALLAYWLVLRSDPRIPILLALGVLLAIVVFTAAGDTGTSDGLGNLFFYVLVLGVAEIAVDSFLERRRDGKGISQKERPFFGRMPARLKRRT